MYAPCGAAVTFRGLGERPLGVTLFADRSLKREMQQVARINRNHRLHATAMEAGSGCNDVLWKRHSLLVLRRNPLSVNEVFLPAIEACHVPRRGPGDIGS